MKIRALHPLAAGETSGLTASTTLGFPPRGTLSIVHRNSAYAGML